MSKGIIYLMSSIVPGLVKIGKIGSNNFNQRMYTLERDGYRNITGLKRIFAIELEDYDDKEIINLLMYTKNATKNNTFDDTLNNTFTFFFMISDISSDNFFMQSG